MRLIDADALKAELMTRYTDPEVVVDEAPTVDAEPVRHGAWSEHFKRPCSTMFDCSECGEIAYDVQKNKKQPKRCLYRYCPHCGAKMDKEASE